MLSAENDWPVESDYVTAVNLSPIRLDQHRKRSTLSTLQYENSSLP